MEKFDKNIGSIILMFQTYYDTVTTGQHGEATLPAIQDVEDMVHNASGQCDDISTTAIDSIVNENTVEGNCNMCISF